MKQTSLSGIRRAELRANPFPRSQAMTSQVVFKRLPIDEIELDSQNPRIAKWVEQYGDKITAEDMSLALNAGDTSSGEASTTFVSLRESIKTNGGLIHPIIVSIRADDRYLVIEGNTRALIYREFRDQNVPGDWGTIPAMVHDGLTDADVEAIRLQAHLVGPRPWDPYSKAKYLNHLSNCRHLTLAQIVDFCGNKSTEVQNYIAAYRDMERHYRPQLESDDQFDPRSFSAFVELQNPRVVDGLLRHGFDKDVFARWVRDELLVPLNTVRQLPRILSNDKVRKIFLKNGAREAIRLLDIPEDLAALKDAPLEILARELSTRILRLSYEDLNRLREESRGDQVDALKDARDQLTQLCADVFSEESV
jgi:hypothetical protein